MSLTTRAVVAILLMIGFYLLAFGLAAGLLWFAYAVGNYLETINVIEVACLIAAGLILWSILPRFDRFKAPGLRVEREQQPRLFAEIAAIAGSLGQKMPHDVYLIPDVNAWVAQRGGIAGLGSRRVMALGLPLMALMTVSQFRAVLAHEFGHCHAGDTKLSPWIYKTRIAIVRTVQNLGSHGSYVTYLYYLFKWYAEKFLRITLAISRAQEYAADQLAALFAGSQAMVDGLKQLHRGSAVWMTYLCTEVGPVLSAGFAPPLSAGLTYFLAVPNINSQAEATLQKELAEGKADLFDSHPSLGERISALTKTAYQAAEDSRSATVLVENLQLADAKLLQRAEPHSLQSISWENVLERVLVPTWQKQIDSQPEALKGLTVRDLGKMLLSGEFIGRVKIPPGLLPTRTERGNLAYGLASSALALALHNDGWLFHTLPGEGYCEKNEHRLEPVVLVNELAVRKRSWENWEELCESSGIGGLPLPASKAVVA